MNNQICSRTAFAHFQHFFDDWLTLIRQMAARQVLYLWNWMKRKGKLIIMVKFVVGNLTIGGQMFF